MSTCDEIIEETKTIPPNFNEKKTTCKAQNFYTSLAFLLITVALLIDVSIYCYQINIEPNKNIYYHFTSQITSLKKLYLNKCIKKMESNDKLKEIDIRNCMCY